jgi:Calcineurin-like phosphoesterase
VKPTLVSNAIQLALLASLAGPAVAPLSAEPFHFVALGDTTYAVPGDYPLYRELIDVVNASAPVFSIHIGDTKGYGDCGRAFQETQRDFFDSYAQPVVYTPGNNEWADCWKDNRGNADPAEILALMRDVFYGAATSRGAVKMPLVRQSDVDAEHREFAENARWEHGGVLFATLNMAGTHNNQELRVEKYWREFQRREEANVAWVEAAFAAAHAAGDKGLVLAFHSNPFDEKLRYPGGPFEPVLQAILSGAEGFDGQVLIVQGHYHEFTIDRPVTELDLDTPAVRRPNITRLQVYGWPDMKAVRVSVDTSKPWVFGFEPLYGEHSVSTTSDSD